VTDGTDLKVSLSFLELLQDSTLLGENESAPDKKAKRDRKGAGNRSSDCPVKDCHLLALEYLSIILVRLLVIIALI
jgi:hypothetical protein